jgi:oligopeptidase A
MKARFKAIEEELSQLSSRFEDNVLERDQRLRAVHRRAARLSGVPADVQETRSGAAEEEQQAGLKLTLRAPLLSAGHAICGRPKPSTKPCTVRYATRASEFGKRRLG